MVQVQPDDTDPTIQTGGPSAGGDGAERVAGLAY